MTKFIAMKKYLPITLQGFGLSFIAYLGFFYFNDLRVYFSSFLPNLFFLSVIFGVVGNYGFALLFKQLLSSYGVNAKDIDAVGIFYTSQIAKYIPGKVWSYLFQMTKIGTPNSAFVIVSSNFQIAMFSLVINSFLGVTIYLLSSNYLLGLAVSVFGVLLSLGIRNLRIAPLIPNRLKAVLGVEDLLSARVGVSVGALITCWAFSVLYVFAHILLLQAFFDVSINSSLKLISFLFVSWVISVFAIIVPAGMGVKEVLFLLFASLDGSYSNSLLVSIALISRFWQMIVDLVGASVIIFVSKAKALGVYNAR